VVTPEEAQRLALIRYQLTLALQQAEQPSPMNGLSVLGFQDVLESFLYLAAEHLHAQIRRTSDFDKLFDAVSDNMPDGRPLGYRAQLLALNTARVNLKHYGNLPDPRTVERHRLSTLAFLEEETPRAFGIGFEDISLTVFIRDATARRHVEEAERVWRDGDAGQTMAALRMAFDRLIKDYRERKVYHPGRSLFTVKPTFDLPNTSDARKLGLKGIMEWLEALDERSALLSFGVDLRRYVFFIAHTPQVFYPLGRPDPVVVRDANEEVEIDEQVYDFCRRFVIDTAMQLTEVDYDYDGWAQRRARQSTET
jgi:hypothetical protein